MVVVWIAARAAPSRLGGPAIGVGEPVIGAG